MANLVKSKTQESHKEWRHSSEEFAVTASKNQMRLISVMYACGGMYGRYAAQHKSGFITAHGFVPIRDGDEWTSGGRFRIICHCDNTTGWHNTIVSRDLYERVVNSLYKLTAAKESP